MPEEATSKSGVFRQVKELVIARSLLYCGDHFGLAKRVLSEYANDLHGYYVRHARWLLKNHGS